MPAAASTMRELARRKSTPKMGNCTAASKKLHVYRSPSKNTAISFSPQQAMSWPPGPPSLGPEGGLLDL